MTNKMQKRLAAYSTASAAIITGSAANGAIIYTADGTTASDNRNIDINNDGTNELTIAPDASRIYIKNVPTDNSTGYAATPRPEFPASTPFQVSALSAGDLIGPALDFQHDNGDSNAMNFTNNLAGDPGMGFFPTDGTVKYIGMRFPVGGTDLYGWIGISLEDPTTSNNYTVTGYAYENTGAPIAAGDVGSPSVPEPAALAPLILGASALLTRRRSTPIS